MKRETKQFLKALEAAEWFSAVGRMDKDAHCLLVSPFPTPFADAYATESGLTDAEPLVGSCEQVNSWEKAVQSCFRPRWDDILIELGNLHVARLCLVSEEAFQRDWNRIGEQVRKAFLPLIEERIAEARKKYRLDRMIQAAQKKGRPHWPASLAKPNFQGWFQRILLGAAMEYELSAYVAPDFRVELARLIIAGRFPCGWKGRFPGGKLVVF